MGGRGDVGPDVAITMARHRHVGLTPNMSVPDVGSFVLDCALCQPSSDGRCGKAIRET
jgi:hypothetical protein